MQNIHSKEHMEKLETREIIFALSSMPNFQINVIQLSLKVLFSNIDPMLSLMGLKCWSVELKLKFNSYRIQLSSFFKKETIFLKKQRLLKHNSQLFERAHQEARISFRQLVLVANTDAHQIFNCSADAVQIFNYSRK